MGYDKTTYLAWRRRFQPVPIKLIIVAESPPASRKFFYNPGGEVREQLFDAMMQQLNVSPETKIEGLRKFQAAGLFLVDATYTPVNKGYNDDQRNLVIANDYPALREDLLELTPDRSVPLVLIKVNVVDVLEPRLKADGFRVLNDGIRPPFPGMGNQPKFHKRFEEILRRGGIAITEATTTREGNHS